MNHHHDPFQKSLKKRISWDTLAGRIHVRLYICQGVIAEGDRLGGAAIKHGLAGWNISIFQ